MTMIADTIYSMLAKQLRGFFVPYLEIPRPYHGNIEKAAPWYK
jgi:hypothetical protein